MLLIGSVSGHSFFGLDTVSVSDSADLPELPSGDGFVSVEQSGGSLEQSSDAVSVAGSFFLSTRSVSLHFFLEQHSFGRSRVSDAVGFEHGWFSMRSDFTWQSVDSRSGNVCLLHGVLLFGVVGSGHAFHDVSTAAD